MRHIHTRTGLVFALVFLGIGVGLLIGTMPGGAVQSDVIESNTTSEYAGVDDGTQTITIVASFTATEDVSGLEIATNPTSDSFVDYASLEPSVRGEGVNITSTGQGVYELDELAEGQTVIIEVDTYPRVLDEERLDVATFQLTAENPRTFEHTETATTNLSNSPHLQYEQAQSELDDRDRFETIGSVGFVGAIGLGLFGLVAAGIMYRRRGRLADQAYESVVADLERFRSNLNDDANKHELDSLITSYRTGDEPQGSTSFVEPSTDDGSEDVESGTAEKEAETEGIDL